jgi:hypothetical protein
MSEVRNASPRSENIPAGGNYETNPNDETKSTKGVKGLSTPAPFAAIQCI